jgi:hypothetical protein
MEKEVKVALISGGITLVGIILAYMLNAWPIMQAVDAPKSEDMIWNFEKDLEGWERTGSAPLWKTDGLKGAVKWHGEWGDCLGIVVMDACTANDQNASAGIKNTINIPKTAKWMVADVAKYEQDGGIRFTLLDSTGPHIIGEEILSGREMRTLSYDISKWAGKTVIIEVKAFGYGDEKTVGCQKGSEACCGEFVGLDSIKVMS